MELHGPQNDITEQRLANQVWAIKVNQWLSRPELHEIQQKVQGKTEIPVENETEETVTEALSEDEPMETGMSSWQMEGNGDEESDITRALIAYLNETSERICIPPLRHVNRKRLMQETKRADHEARKINTANITETNELIYACVRVVSERLGIKLT